LVVSLAFMASACGGRSDAGPRVRDIADKVGLGLDTRTFGAVVFDVDGDGWPDLLVGRHNDAAYLYRNDHGKLVRVLKNQFPGHVDRHRCAAGDLNNDGRIDLFCVIGGESGNGPKGTPNELWIQQANGSFVNTGDNPELADPYGRGRQPLLFDANGDGRLDILVGNVSPRNDGKPSNDRLFLNMGGNHWRSAPEYGLDLPYSVGGAGPPGAPHGGGNWPMGCLRSLDYDGDGHTDVLMCAQSPSEKTQSLHLFHNEGGKKFREVTAEVGLNGVTALDAAVVDTNGDGRPDIVTVDGKRLAIYRQVNGRFSLAYQLPITMSQRVEIGDANGDHLPDIYVMRTRGIPGPDVPDMLLLRKGTTYDEITLPAVAGNVRDDEVYPIDLFHNGKDEFVVLHGHSLSPAPIQVIEVS
jgi:hypothetical protein